MKVLRAGFIALLFAVLLSTTDHLTYPIITDNRLSYENRQIVEMVAGRDFIGAEAGYEVFEYGQLFGFIKAVNTDQGYNGNIRLLIAYDIAGEVLAVRITEHRETPGLGDAIDRDWIETFTGRDAQNNEWALTPEGDFDAITGATITSRAVVMAVAEALQQ